MSEVVRLSYDFLVQPAVAPEENMSSRKAWPRARVEVY